MSENKLVVIDPETRERVKQALSDHALAIVGDSNDAEAEAAQELADLLSEVTGVSKADVRDPVSDHAAARAAERIAVLLGAADDWDGGADFLEEIAEILHLTGGFRHPGNDENKRYYRAAYPDWNQ